MLERENFLDFPTVSAAAPRLKKCIKSFEIDKVTIVDLKYRMCSESAFCLLQKATHVYEKLIKIFSFSILGTQIGEGTLIFHYDAFLQSIGLVTCNSEIDFPFSMVIFLLHALLYVSKMSKQ